MDFGGIFGRFWTFFGGRADFKTDFGGILIGFWTVRILGETDFGRILDRFCLGFGRILDVFWTEFCDGMDFGGIKDRFWTDF